MTLTLNYSQLVLRPQQLYKKGGDFEPAIFFYDSHPDQPHVSTEMTYF